jgi:hypothetical protein
LIVALHAVLSHTRLAGLVFHVKTFPTFFTKSCGDGALFAVGVITSDAVCLVEEETFFAGSACCGVGTLADFAHTLTVGTETRDY